METLEGEMRRSEARRERLELPPVDKEMLSGFLSEFEETIANGANPKKKHLLPHMVKKVLIHDRRTIEVWYELPNQASVRTAGYLAPHLGQRNGSTSKKNGAKRPRFSAVREQLFHLEHPVEIFGDRDKLVAIGVQDRVIVILHRVNTQLVITAGL